MKKLTGSIKKDMKIILKDLEGKRDSWSMQEYIETRKRLEGEEQEYIRGVFKTLDEEEYISSGTEGKKSLIDGIDLKCWGIDLDTFVTRKGKDFMTGKDKASFILTIFAAFSSTILLVIEIIRFIIEVF